MKAQPIDMSHLERYVDGDEALRDEVLCLFETQVVVWEEKFEAQIDTEELHNIVHTIKGAARAIGAFDLGRVCEATERLVSEGHLDDKDAQAACKERLLTTLRAEIDATVEAIRQIRALQSPQ